MAFRSRTASAEIQAATIPPLSEHPEYARLAALGGTLRAAMAERQRLIDIDAHETDLSGSSGRVPGPRARRINESLTRLQQQAVPTRVNPADAAGAGALPQSVVSALRIAGGDQIPLEPDRAARLARLRGELRVLDTAWCEVENLLAGVVAEASETIARAEAARHAELLRVYFAAASAMAAAIQAERRHYADVLIAGYTGRPDLMLRPSMNGALRIGSFDDHDSEISTERRRFETLGVL